jgi:hypothetical protein
MKERMETREQLSRNLLTEPMTTIEAIAQVEGSVWLNEQEALNRETADAGQYTVSLPNALERVQAGKPATINGRDGRNRWFVETDGSISFSETHAETPDHVAKARELGFEIVP